MGSAIFQWAAQKYREMHRDWCIYRDWAISAADEACNGYVINRAGLDKGYTLDYLWGRPEKELMSYATAELREYLEAHPRKTLEEFEVEWMVANHGE